MVELSTLVVFALACVALTATPGPDMLLIASRSASQGRIAGLATYMGIAFGLYCHALAAAFGLSKLFLAVPIAYDAIRIIGAIYLLYLAWVTLKSKSDASELTKTRKISFWVMFRQGMFTNLLNPKVALFVLALFPQFIEPDAGNVALQIMILATILNIIGLLVNGIVILTVDKLGSIFSVKASFKRLPQIFLSTVFVGLATRLVFDTRN
ncbi:LysE family translocator [Amylibacter sp. SFDW26]|uniref:LysE family translocator n=1 Tax=Amylibacter sp. SFDW26 TaxID=2652722 RepID=UPI0012619681|nr:LysE family translocator [Amylibacter sp. SFDW26]KAB7615482.1 LysE family translocator [Amylibacter sp. SFDW26]